MTGSPLRSGTATGMISAARRPSAWAAAVFSWLHREKRSWSSRLMENSAARFSAVSGMVSTPYSSFIRLLTNRQPMVVSCISRLPRKCFRGLAHDKGRAGHAFHAAGDEQIRLASHNGAGGARPRLPCPSRTSRLTVQPEIVSGKPARSKAMRATFRLSSPAWLAQPRMTSSTAAQSTALLRSISALIGRAAKSSVRMVARAPP